ncbi:MAG: MogA/MoaB family molybdenum cofactor biosynthesis protein [Candidatus Caldarchaeales archaeon]
MGTGAVREHRERAPKSVRVGIVTASTSRHAALRRGERVVDDSGDAVEEVMRGRGYSVVRYGVVDDDLKQIREAVLKGIAEGCDAFVVIGGTGIAMRDVTVEAVRPLFERELPGFGEVLRLESYKRIGAAAMLSRATAGIVRGAAVFAFPGSPDGARLAAELIADELPHLIGLLRGQ